MNIQSKQSIKQISNENGVANVYINWKSEKNMLIKNKCEGMVLLLQQCIYERIFFFSS